ncbi:MAG: hypothetical protein KC917_14135, partial [Candidatus Omnitrophica bacterium]|nr:hypothetical protein [Candidatus Omnitrophota bacterium]
MARGVSLATMAGLLLVPMVATVCVAEDTVKEMEGVAPMSNNTPTILNTLKPNSDDPTAMGRWQAALEQVLPEPKPLPFHNVHLIGPFENMGYQGLLAAYPPEQEIDLAAVYQGKAGEVIWQRAPGLDGLLQEPKELSEWLTPEAWSVIYVYAEVEVEEPQIAELATGTPANVWAWANGELTIAPVFPHLERPVEDRAFIKLRPGTNKILLKLHIAIEPWSLSFHFESYGRPKDIEAALADVLNRSPDDVTRLLARYTLAEIFAIQGKVEATHQALDALRGDPFATKWDIAWADAVMRQHSETGSFLPLHDVRFAYTPVTG